MRVALGHASRSRYNADAAQGRIWGVKEESRSRKSRAKAARED